MKRRAALFLLLCTVALAQGQAPAAPAIPPMPPGPPIQARAPDYSQWTITLTETAPSSPDATPSTPEAPIPTKSKIFFGSVYTITKTGKIMSRQTLDDQSRAWVTWCAADLQITIYPNNTVLAQPRPDDLGFPNPYYVDYLQSDFPDFWWISTKNYAGIKSQAGKPCLYFKDYLKFYSDDNLPSNVEAYIDVKTRYPVLVIVNTTSRAYAFQPPPTSELELPKIVQSLLKKRTQATANATRRMPTL
jgi:hypothetical protein